jgi:hypothetical protein
MGFKLDIPTKSCQHKSNYQDPNLNVWERDSIKSIETTLACPSWYPYSHCLVVRSSLSSWCEDVDVTSGGIGAADGPADTQTRDLLMTVI